MGTGKKELLTRSAIDALLRDGPNALAALDHIIEATPIGAVSRCGSCSLRHVENFRNEQARAQLRSIREKLAKWVSEAHASSAEVEP